MNIVVLLYTRLLIQKDNCISSLCLFYLLAFFCMCLCMYMDTCSSLCTEGDSRCLTAFYLLSFWDDGGLTDPEVSRLAWALGPLLSQPSHSWEHRHAPPSFFLNVNSYSGPLADPASAWPLERLSTLCQCPKEVNGELLKGCSGVKGQNAELHSINKHGVSQKLRLALFVRKTGFSRI